MAARILNRWLELSAVCASVVRSVAGKHPGHRLSAPVALLRGETHKRLPSLNWIANGLLRYRQASITSATQPSPEEKLKHTALYETHLKYGGKMVPFAGYALPVMYSGEKGGIKNEHLQVRQSAGVFDVSHMGQVRVYGTDRVRFLERLIVADLQALPAGTAVLSLLTNEHGGIIDDTIITNLGKDNTGAEALNMVINGACVDKDMAHLRAHERRAREVDGMDVRLEFLADRSLLALQGPKAMQVLQHIVDRSTLNLEQMAFMNARMVKAPAFSDYLLVSRCGYTGEDGFEISVHNQDAPKLFEMLVSNEAVLPCGLGARDSLRMEAGLCLYGNDIDENTTPVSAGLTWTIAKSRRNPDSGDGRPSFLGADVILKEIANPSIVQKKRVGFILHGGPPARGHETIHENSPKAADNAVIGTVTSGGFSPTRNCAIGMGYISKPMDAVGTRISVKIRGKLVPGEVVKMPFVKTNYYKP
jgi:aminomethyltransferase